MNERPHPCRTVVVPVTLVMNDVIMPRIPSTKLAPCDVDHWRCDVESLQALRRLIPPLRSHSRANEVFAMTHRARWHRSGERANFCKTQFFSSRLYRNGLNIFLKYVG
jgi:hypothetical protein